jgi:hypothetical protein
MKATTVANPHRMSMATLSDEQFDGLASVHKSLHPDKPKPGTAPANDCTCYLECRADSHSGRWHQHEDDPCPAHPDAPMVG